MSKSVYWYSNQVPSYTCTNCYCVNRPFFLLYSTQEGWFVPQEVAEDFVTTNSMSVLVFMWVGGWSLFGHY